MFVPVGLAVNELLNNKVTYSIRNFEPIALIAKVPNAIVASKKLGITSLKGLVDYSAANSEKVAYAANSAGSSAHLSGELLRYETKANLLHVPYNGDAPAVMAMRSGDADVGIMNLSSAATLIKSGNHHILAVTTAKRAPNFPDIPTVAESGVPKYEVSSYFGLAAPAGTSPEIVKKLNESLMKALERPAIKNQLEQLGFIIERNSPADFKNFLVNEHIKWRAIIKESGIKLFD